MTGARTADAAKAVLLATCEQALIATDQRGQTKSSIVLHRDSRSDFKLSTAALAVVASLERSDVPARNPPIAEHS